MTIITRAQYMAREYTHAEYYRQFVTPAVLALVKNAIGEISIKASTCEHFNDIPLRKWDAIVNGVRARMNQEAKRQAEPSPHEFMWSVSDGVCIAKQAAAMIREIGK